MAAGKREGGMTRTQQRAKHLGLMAPDGNVKAYLAWRAELRRDYAVMTDWDYKPATALGFGWLAAAVLDGQRVPFGQSWEWYERMKQEAEARA